MSDIYAPVAGVVAAVNEALDAAPETINADPYGAGWLVDIAVHGEGGDPIGHCSTPTPTRHWSTAPDGPAAGLRWR